VGSSVRLPISDALAEHLDEFITRFEARRLRTVDLMHAYDVGLDMSIGAVTDPSLNADFGLSVGRRDWVGVRGMRAAVRDCDSPLACGDFDLDLHGGLGQTHDHHRRCR
jgi:hypothetical protein